MTTTTKHTPGPWRCDEDVNLDNVKPRMGVWIGLPKGAWDGLHPDAKRAQMAADMALIAAAPDLLAALIAAEDDLSDVPGREDPPSLAAVRAAIAKARGGA